MTVCIQVFSSNCNTCAPDSLRVFCDVSLSEIQDKILIRFHAYIFVRLWVRLMNGACINHAVIMPENKTITCMLRIYRKIYTRSLHEKSMTFIGI